MARNSGPWKSRFWRAGIFLSLVLLAPIARPVPVRAEQKPGWSGLLPSPATLLNGLSQLQKLRPFHLGINFRYSFINVQIVVPPAEPLGPRLAELERCLREASDEQRKLLQAQLEQLKILNEAAALANEYRRKQLDHEARLFEYQQGVLRKERYDLPVNTLTVVVADFSSGEPARGREVADELAAQIRGLRSLGVDVHVLVGEIKPGVVIRSEELAQDVGKHFPPHTSYAVLWGSMSELTTGAFRAHVTCAYKRNEHSGVSASYTLDLDPQELPAAGGPTPGQRDHYAQLIGVACAAVPKCYVAHCLNHDREPDLSRLYGFLGPDKPAVKELQAEVALASKWVRGRPAGVTRLSEITEQHPYPRQIVNTRDDASLVLITDERGEARVFTDPARRRKYIAYIDAAEVSLKQFVRFLNEQGNRDEGGVSWLKQEDEEGWQEIAGDGPGRYAVRRESYLNAPAFNVSFFGARAYCGWAGKQLPTREEWLAAAAPGGQAYPWGERWDEGAANWQGAARRQGKEYPRSVGTFARDKSLIGCLDMAGNVAEWCADFADQQKGERVVCGGSWRDEAAALDVRQTRPVAQVSRERWLGFRGVLRIDLAE